MQQMDVGRSMNDVKSTIFGRNDVKGSRGRTKSRLVGAGLHILGGAQEVVERSDKRCTKSQLGRFNIFGVSGVVVVMAVVRW